MRTRRFQSSSDPVLGNPSTSVGANRHQSVLLQEAVELIALKQGETFVDATLGGAGHALASIGKLGEKGRFVGFDLDHEAIERAQEALKGVVQEVHLVEANFRDMSLELKKLGITKVDKVLP